MDSSLNATKARGKVLVCYSSDTSSQSRIEKSLIVKKAGGVGMILVDENEEGLAMPFAIPAATVNREIGEKILSYVNHTRCIQFASLFEFDTFPLTLMLIIAMTCSRRAASMILPPKTVIGSRPAPWVAAFSSKGPNSPTPQILKVSNKLELAVTSFLCMLLICLVGFGFSPILWLLG